MPGLFFGTGGVPLSSAERSTISGIQRIGELGLGCMEVEFVHGVSMGAITARQVKDEAAGLGVKLSVHAPYYINFNSDDAEKRRSSGKRLVESARVGAMCGARNIVFHAAFYMKNEPSQVYAVVKAGLAEITRRLREESIDVCLRPEVTGKATQLGTVEETLELCRELPGLLPCLDVSHWHARTGGFNSYDEVIEVLRLFESRLGKPAIEDMHLHFSGIQYSRRGEIKHLPLKESDMKYDEILRGFKDFGIKGTVICESPNLEEDALLLKKTYDALPGKG